MQSNDTLDNPLRWTFPGDTFFVSSRQEMLDMFLEDCTSEVDEKLLQRPEEEWKIDSEDTIYTKTIDFINKKTGKPDKTEKTYMDFKHNIPIEIIEEACDNTIVIADMCNIEIKFDQTYLPKMDIPHDNEEFIRWRENRIKRLELQGKEFETEQASYLRYLCIKGLKDKGLTSVEYRDRLEYELDVIISMGFPDYFLLLQDVVNWCALNDIPVGPGRGCFVPGQKVETSNGSKNIEDVKVGDLVLTHRGNLKEVKSVQKYESEENVSIIKFQKYKDSKIQEVKSTQDHEYFIIPKHYGKDFKNTKWAMAQELEEGDLLLMPIQRKDACKHSHKGHEGCINCFGKQNPDFIEDANKQFHETAFNASRVVEKTIKTLGVKVVDDNQNSNLDKAMGHLQEMQEVFGFNEVINSELSIEEFSGDLLELGYELAFVVNVTEEEYEGNVYDLTVEGDTSYTVNGLAVHNSAAGSLVSYAIGITNVNPIQYGLLFERFLNPSRGKLPDIDIDFCIENRGRVMKYIMERFGQEHTANIATFGRLQTKAVIKDVGKAMGIPFDEVNAFTKLLPSGPGASVHVEEVFDMPEAQFFVQKYPKLFEYAAKLESSPRHVSQHAAGMVVSPPEHPIWSLIPIQRGKEVADGVAGYLTQLEKTPVEQLGLNIA